MEMDELTRTVSVLIDEARTVTRGATAPELQPLRHAVAVYDATAAVVRARQEYHRARLVVASAAVAEPAPSPATVPAAPTCGAPTGTHARERCDNAVPCALHPHYARTC